MGSLIEIDLKSEIGSKLTRKKKKIDPKNEIKKAQI